MVRAFDVRQHARAMDLSNVPVSPAPARPPLPPAAELGFGRLFAPRVLLADHDARRGWHSPRIVTLAEANVSIATGGVQYALSIFDGLKAFRDPSGALRLFRPDMHARRLFASAERLSMPPLPVEDFVEGLRVLLREEEPSCPGHAAGALYVRPTIVATESFLGVRPARDHQLAVLLSPVGGYFSNTGQLRLWAERELVRAAPGGLGAAKTGANYAASVLAAERAKARGFDQVLWLDAVEKRWLAEVGTMNLFVELAGEVVTPPLDGTILAGVTRDAALTLLREWKVRVSERPLSLDELAAADRAGELRAIFGTGTAAVIADVGEITWESTTVRPRGGEIATRLRQAITGIQHGTAPDPHGWMVRV
jgi:branched-chain amino acid aminotransferase